MDTKPIISIKEARSLIGKGSIGLSDKQIIELITQTQELAKLALDAARCKLDKEKHDKI